MKYSKGFFIVQHWNMKLFQSTRIRFTQRFSCFYWTSFPLGPATNFKPHVATNPYSDDLNVRNVHFETIWELTIIYDLEDSPLWVRNVKWFERTFRSIYVTKRVLWEIWTLKIGNPWPHPEFGALCLNLMNEMFWNQTSIFEQTNNLLISSY